MEPFVPPYDKVIIVHFQNEILLILNVYRRGCVTWNQLLLRMTR